MVLLPSIISFPSAWATQILTYALQVDLEIASVARSQVAGDV